jgi:hypothetical protein
MSAAESINGIDKETLQHSHEQAQPSPTENFCVRLSQECNQVTKSVTDHATNIAITEGAIVGVIAAAVITHRIFPQALPAIKQVLGFGAEQSRFMTPATDVLIRSGIEINPITRSTMGSIWGGESAARAAAIAARDVRCTEPAIDTLLGSGIGINPQTRMAFAGVGAREIRSTQPAIDALINSGIKINPQTRSMAAAEFLNLHRP